MQFELSQLNAFLAIVRRGSVSLAAKELSIYQSSLSRSMQKLERTIGVKLFNHRTSGLTLTPEGKKFIPHAEAMLAEYERALIDVGVRAADTNQLRIGVSGGFLFDWMPKWIGDVRTQYPGVQINVVTRGIEAVMQMVKARELDFAVVQAVEFARVMERMEQELQFRFCGRETCSAFVTPDHPVMRKRRPTLQDAAKCEWALPGEMSVVYPFEGEFVRAGVAVPKYALMSSSLEFLYRMAVDLKIPAILPARYAAAVPNGGLSPLPIPELKFNYLVTVITSRSPTRSKQVANCIEMLTESCPA